MPCTVPLILPYGDATSHECFGVDGLRGDRPGHSSCLAIMTIGFDLKGIVGDRTSEAEAFMHRLGFDREANV